MKRIVTDECGTIEYELVRKRVKNINLRVRKDATVHVSASRWVSEKVIDAFVLSKAELVRRAMEHYTLAAHVEQTAYFTKAALLSYITDFAERAYPYYESRGIAKPQLRFRRMVSRWGSCHPTKGILTFNTNLIYATPACVEYVIWHEFTHFLQANHSRAFYEALACVCPDWKARRDELKAIVLRK